MMEVTPHLKTVLKNYQHSATKSLQGPGQQSHHLSAKDLLSTSCSPTSVTVKDEHHHSYSHHVSGSTVTTASATVENDFVPAQPFPIQQLPILTAADTTCSERTETVLESQTISCFVVGGEKRLCLPQVLKSVLYEFSLTQINQECDKLQIYCSRCTADQLNVLKSHQILPSSAPSCGLITKTDAERLCSALLLQQQQQNNGTNAKTQVRKGALSFVVQHKCFGNCRGACTPELYTSKTARCIECLDCRGWFSPQQFVCHVHGDLENRTVHWGFDSTSWRAYMLVCKDQSTTTATSTVTASAAVAVDNQEQYVKCLDELCERYEGKVPFPARPPPVVSPTTLSPSIGTPTPLVLNGHHHHHKRKLLTRAQDLHKVDFAEIPLKKNKLDNYTPLHAYHPPLHQIFLDYGNYMPFVPLASAFNPIRPISHKESKIRQAIALNNLGYNPTAATVAPKSEPAPVLLQQSGTVSDKMHVDHQHFNGNSKLPEMNGLCYQPNVTLAPATPKKYRYFNKAPPDVVRIKVEQPDDTYPGEVTSSVMKDSVIKIEKTTTSCGEESPGGGSSANSTSVPTQHSPDSQSVIDSTVSVVQSTRSLNRYHSEIELSTDTDDTCSEISEKVCTVNGVVAALDDVLKAVPDVEVRERIASLVHGIKTDGERERDEYDAKVRELERRVIQLQQRLDECLGSERMRSRSNSTRASNTTVTSEVKDRSDVMEEELDVVDDGPDDSSASIGEVVVEDPLASRTVLIAVSSDPPSISPPLADKEEESTTTTCGSPGVSATTLNSPNSNSSATGIADAPDNNKPGVITTRDDKAAISRESREK